VALSKSHHKNKRANLDKQDSLQRLCRNKRRQAEREFNNARRYEEWEEKRALLRNGKCSFSILYDCTLTSVKLKTQSTKLSGQIHRTIGIFGRGKDGTECSGLARIISSALPLLATHQRLPKWRAL
jgi:hypothetical protein